MLNQETIKALLCHRYWFFRFTEADAPYESRPGVMFLGGNIDDQCSYFIIEFRENGRIKFPTNLGYHPTDYHSWIFDEEKQEIIIISEDGRLEKHLQPPKKGYYGGNVITINPEDAGNSDNIEFFINLDHYNAWNVTQRTLGSESVVFVAESQFNRTLTQHFARRAYSVHLVENYTNLMGFLKEVCEYIMEHPHVKNVIIAPNGDGNIPIEFPKEIDHVLFANNTKKSTSFSFDYCAGKRSIMVELLLTIIGEDSKRLLNPDDHRSEEDALRNTITNIFASRYEVGSGM